MRNLFVGGVAAPLTGEGDGGFTCRKAGELELVGLLHRFDDLLIGDLPGEGALIGVEDGELHRLPDGQLHYIVALQPVPEDGERDQLRHRLHRNGQ